MLTVGRGPWPLPVVVLASWAILVAAMLLVSRGHPNAHDWIMTFAIGTAATVGQATAWWLRRHTKR